MSSQARQPGEGFRTTLIVLNLVVALPAIGLGLITLISPDVPAAAAAENTAVGAGLLATAVFLIYALFRPFSGGMLLLVWAVAFAALMNGFHLSEILFDARRVGYSSFWSAFALLLAVLGVLSIVLARRSQTVVDVRS